MSPSPTLRDHVYSIMDQLCAPHQINWSTEHPYTGLSRFTGTEAPDQVDLTWPVWLFDHRDLVWRYLTEAPADWGPYTTDDRSKAMLVYSRLRHALAAMDSGGQRERIVGEMRRLAESGANQSRNIARLRGRGAVPDLTVAAQESLSDTADALAALLGRWFDIMDEAQASRAAAALIEAETVQQGGVSVLAFDAETVAELRRIDPEVTVSAYQSVPDGELGEGVFIATRADPEPIRALVAALHRRAGSEVPVTVTKADSGRTLMWVREAVLEAGADVE